jgi:type I restriction enzyme S subunit
MSSKWETVPLGNLVSIKGGKRLPKGENLQEENNEHPYIRVRDMHEGQINPSDLLYVPDNIFPKISRYIVNSGDVVISIVGTIGLVGIIGDNLDNANLTENAAKLTNFSEKLLPKYLYYFISSTLGQSQIHALTVGTTQRKLALKRVAMIEIPLPPLPTQERIADILGTLDDKIELNRQMNHTLEAMARAIFKSWFVDFDPVYSKMEGRDYPLPAEVMDLFPDELVESELGLIPKGWEVGKLKQGFNITMGQSPPGSTYNEDGDGLPFYQGRRDFGFRYPALRVYCNAPKRLAQPNDSLVSVRAPVGDVNMAKEECCIGRGVAAVRHKTGSASYTYYSMLKLKDYFNLFESEGTVFGSIGKKDFENLIVVIPPMDFILTYESYVGILDKKIENNSKEVDSITTIRDELLPKLVSGDCKI